MTVLALKVKQINAEFSKGNIQKTQSLFSKLSALTNKALSELNLTKVKAAVLKHDSKLCQ